MNYADQFQLAWDAVESVTPADMSRAVKVRVANRVLEVVEKAANSACAELLERLAPASRDEIISTRTQLKDHWITVFMETNAGEFSATRKLEVAGAL